MPGLASTATVNGLPILIAALESNARKHGQGIITVSNHISTLDDPLTWGVLPANFYLSSRRTRWALGASDIMFTNPVFSAFFRLGQTLETFRGKGIYQPAVDSAIKFLNQGDWVHLYGEGKVRQPDTYSVIEDGSASLPRFKWGVGRIIMEAAIPPVVIPMWLTGFDRLMPEGRPFPNKYLPHLGARLSVTFGEPIPLEDIQIPLRKAKELPSELENQPGWLTEEARKSTGFSSQGYYAAIVRSEITAIIQCSVQALGRSISGQTLSNHPNRF